jgi:hypothetical protein
VITIAENGLEFRTIERLTRAFEQDHHETVVEIQWGIPSSTPFKSLKLAKQLLP